MRAFFGWPKSMKVFPLWAQTLVALSIFVLVFCSLNALKPHHPFAPTGVFLPANGAPYPVKADPTQVVYLRAPRAVLVGHINLEMHTTDPDQTIKTLTLDKAREMAHAQGADRVLFIGDGYNQDFNAYILEAAAYRLP